MDSKLGAMTSTWKEDLIQQEPADRPDGYGPTDITRAKGKDADEGTTACVMDVDRGQVVLSEIVRHKGEEMTTEERECRIKMYMLA